MWVLVRVALVPVAVSYAVVVLLAGVVTGIASGTLPGGAPGVGQAFAVGVPLWLAAHLVPLRLDGAPVSVLPLVPVLGIGLTVALVARRGVAALGGRWSGAGVPVVATAAAAHAACGVLAAALLTPETVVDASPALAGVVCGTVAALAALAGVARPTGLLARSAHLPDWLRRGVRAGLLATALLVCAGAVLLTAALLAQAGAVTAASDRLAPDAGSGVGLLLLTVGYLPNAVVGSVAWLLGPGIGIGAVAVSPTAVVPGLLPPLPLVAVLPTSSPPSWAALTLAVPLAVGSIVGWRLAAQPGGSGTRLRALGVAAVVAATATGAAAALAGGRLGAGPFDPVSVSAGPVALAVLAWVALPGAVVAVLAVPDPRVVRRAGAPARSRAAGRAASGGSASGGSASTSTTSTSTGSGDETVGVDGGTAQPDPAGTELAEPGPVEGGTGDTHGRRPSD